METEGRELQQGEEQGAAPGVDLEEESPGRSFPVIGIGASAGGLEALEAFFTHMPSESGMAFVVVQHLSPKYKSAMDDLLKKRTQMEVLVVEDGTRAEPNTIYLNPPDKEVALFNGILHLVTSTGIHGFRLPIDYFFRSLAEDRGEKAICIILSGTGTDGSIGLRSIKEAGGMAMVQEEKQAKYGGMPRSAIDTGLVDSILPVEKMPDELMEYVKHPYIRGAKEVRSPERQFRTHMQKILMLVRSGTGHDFTNYKQKTMLRRVERRMALHKIDSTEIYLRYLQENPVEVQTLFKDVLIGVTNFFRDPDAFEALEEKALMKIVAAKQADAFVRIWVPGCATGEEAFSLAILLEEAMERVGKRVRAQIFATDINPEAIEYARGGAYPETIAADVTKERLERYFTKDENKYKVKKEIRETVVFAMQNLITNPPFSRLDLVSCRNLLIYLNATLQKKLLPLFHYTLNEAGYLFLGSSESIGEFIDLFSPIDTKWKIYRRKDSASRQVLEYPLPPFTDWAPWLSKSEEKRVPKEIKVRELTEKIILENHSPVCVLINEKYEVLYLHGLTKRYLEIPIGEPSFNLLKMADERLRYALSIALHKAVGEKRVASSGAIQIKEDGRVRSVDITVRPVEESGGAQELLLLVVFEEKVLSDRASRRKKTPPEPAVNPQVLQLEEELQSTREYLQTIIEELEASNEELQATNEEFQSANEELQSTNEEIETSKEELQSTNEELITVNSELQTKVDELSHLNNDINNLLASTEIGTVFLDNRLRIRRFTPSLTKLFSLIATDIGRPISDITHKIRYADLYMDAREVLSTLNRKEVEVQTEDGGWFSLRMIPYRTVDNVIDGVVLTFVDVSSLKRAELLADSARTYAENILNTMREPFLVLDDDLRVISANASFYRLFGVSEGMTENVPLYQLGNGQWDIPRLRGLLDQVIAREGSFQDFEVEHDFPGIGRKKILLDARLIPRTSDRPRLILLAMEDITDRKR